MFEAKDQNSLIHESSDNLVSFFSHLCILFPTKKSGPTQISDKIYLMAGVYLSR